MSWKGGEKWWKGQLGGRRDGGEEKNGLNSSHMVGKKLQRDYGRVYRYIVI